MNTDIERSQRWLYAVGLLIALGAPFLPLSKWEHEFSSVGHLIGYELIWWALVGVVLVQTLIVERDRLSSLGFKTPTWVEAIVAIAAGVLTLGGLAFLYYWALPRLQVNETSGIHQLMRTPVWWRIVSVIRAAVGEEILFRGYAISRLRRLLRNLPLAAILSWAMFTIAHVGPWGWGHLIIAGFGGLVLTLVFLWRGNLWVSIIAHAVIDGAAVLS